MENAGFLHTQEVGIPPLISGGLFEAINLGTDPY